jgi:arylsulfatase A-like enzyme
MANRPPNIFVFMSDQEQAQVVKKGHPCKSPVAEKLAEEGILFDRCYTPTAHSCPARGCYFTGLYPSVHKVYNNVCNAPKINGTFDPSCRMFSENLRAAGWNLGLTGKWHVSDTEDPKDRGWDEVFPTATKEAHMGMTWEQWEKGGAAGMSDEPRKPGEIIVPGYQRRPMYASLKDRDYTNTNDYQVVTKAVEAMEQYVKEDKPFFIHCGPTGPHDPYIVPEQYVNQYDLADVPLPPNYHDDLKDKPVIYQRHNRQLWSQFSEEEVRDSVRHYWAYCAMMDDHRALVYDAIDRLGIRDNTILIFTSDHGDYVGAHGLYCKGIPAFDEGVRVPLIVRWPEGIEDPGRVIDEYVTLCDFAPTFLEAAGVEQNPTHGASMAPFFKSSDVPGWTQEFHTQMNGVEYYYTQRASQTKEWKYVFNGFDWDELYDLRNDPYEMKNLTNDPACQDIKKDMVKRMWRHAHKTKDITGNRYWTVALAPWGPMVAFED